MFIINKIVILLHERWKYLLVWYMVGYLISIMQSGMPNFYYLIPLKPFAIGLSWAMGNVCYKIIAYYNVEKKKKSVVRLPMYMNFYYGIKYGLPALIFTLVYCFMIVIIGGIFNFDSAPFLAPFK